MVTIKLVSNTSVLFDILHNNEDKEVLYAIDTEECLSIIKEAMDNEDIEYEFVKLDEKEINYCKKFINASGSRAKVVVSLEKNQEFKTMAYYQAKLTDSDFAEVDSFEEIIKLVMSTEYEFYTFVIPVSEISMTVINKMQVLQNKYVGADREFYYGILTARNLSVLNALIIKNEIYKKKTREGYVVVNRLDYNEKNVCNNEDCTSFAYYTALTENIYKAGCEQGLNAISLIGHGRDDILWLTDGSICGRTRNCLSKRNEGYRLPICAYRDRCLMSNKQAINIYSLRARNMFANACKSSKLENSVFGNDYNLSLSFIEGVGASYIGCNSTIMGSEASNYYYTAMLRAGVSLGEITYRLTKMYQNKNMELTEYYQLLGDPTYSNCVEKNILNYKIISLNDNGEDNVFSFDIPQNIEMICVELPVKDFELKFYSLEWKFWGHLSSQRLFAAFRSEGEKTVLDLFSIGSIKGGEKLTIKIKYNNSLYPEYIYRLSRLVDMGFADSRLKNPINEAKEVALRLFSTYERRMNLIDCVDKELYKKMDRLYARIPKLSKLLIEYLVDGTHKEGYSWEESTRKSGLKYEAYNDSKNDEKCCSCGRDTYAIISGHIYYSLVKRINYNCPICGFSADYPVKHDDVIIRFDDNYVVEMDKESVHRVFIKNCSGMEQIGYGGIAVTAGKKNHFSYIKNNISIKFRPYEEKTFEFSLMCSDETKPHQYWLYLYIILNGEVYVQKKDIWLRDKMQEED